ncbi:rRNA biogenesis protein rrp36 [Parahypoxylon ruwenzoriense]
MDRITANKRKAPISKLQRRVRARKEEDEPELDGSDEVFSDASQGEGTSEDEDEHEEGVSGEDEEEDDAEESSSDDDDDDDDDDEELHDPSAAVSQISFGALAKAQASLPSIRRTKKDSRTAERDSDDDDESSDATDSKPKSSRSQAPKPHRANKHAPTEQTSKRPVTRRREVVLSGASKREARDPRFSAAVSSRPADPDRQRQAYAFLDAYRDSEELKRAVASMESRKQAQAQRDRERALLEEHRRREKDMVSRGAKQRPFYLKKSEQKRQLLKDRYGEMKKGQVDRAIERRRKKLTARERRDMPLERRER